MAASVVGMPRKGAPGSRSIRYARKRARPPRRGEGGTARIALARGLSLALEFRRAAGIVGTAASPDREQSHGAIANGPLPVAEAALGPRWRDHISL
jgi:hypothetical protein